MTHPLPMYEDPPRPSTRGECVNGIRPCPFVSCRYHLYLDVAGEDIRLNFPDKEPDELQETCVLDVADRGGITLEELGSILDVTKECVRQNEVKAERGMRMSMKDTAAAYDIDTSNGVAPARAARDGLTAERLADALRQAYGDRVVGLDGITDEALDKLLPFVRASLKIRFLDHGRMLSLAELAERAGITVSSAGSRDNEAFRAIGVRRPGGRPNLQRHGMPILHHK